MLLLQFRQFFHTRDNWNANNLDVENNVCNFAKMRIGMTAKRLFMPLVFAAAFLETSIDVSYITWEERDVK